MDTDTLLVMNGADTFTVNTHSVFALLEVTAVVVASEPADKPKVAAITPFTAEVKVAVKVSVVAAVRVALLPIDEEKVGVAGWINPKAVFESAAGRGVTTPLPITNVTLSAMYCGDITKLVTT